MDGPRDYHIKWKKSDNYHTISYVESKKMIEMKLFTEQK